MTEIDALKWFHTIDLPDGRCTPGVFDSRPIAHDLRWPPGLSGGRCLDVGTCDGFWAFEMERRGAAEVVAVDVDDPDQLDLADHTRPRDQALMRDWQSRRGRTFDAARQALGSRVERVDCSVYDLDPAIHGRFDVVFCGALLVHLRDPFRALERMREVCAGELMLVEGVDTILDLFARPLPCARFAPYENQWWRMNGAGLTRIVRVAGFEVIWVSRRFVTPLHVPSASSAGTNGLRTAGPRRATTVLLDRLHAPALVSAAVLRRGAVEVALRARPRASEARP